MHEMIGLGGTKSSTETISMEEWDLSKREDILEETAIMTPPPREGRSERYT